MIDLHSHILPALDDGAEDLRESIGMARSYTAAGFKEVAATPHCYPGSSPAPSPELIQERVREVNETLAAEEIELTVWPGMELAIDAAIPEMIDAGAVQTLGGSTYLLVEPPFQRLPFLWEKIIDAVQSRGYRLLLAHPERCAQIAQSPEILEGLLSAEVYFQVNWGSLLGIHGQDAEALAWTMLMKGWIHCLATDSHDARFRNAGLVDRAAAIVRKKIGPGPLDRLTCKNPARVLKGLPLKTIDVSASRRKPEKKRMWRLWQ